MTGVQGAFAVALSHVVVAYGVVLDTLRRPEMEEQSQLAQPLCTWLNTVEERDRCFTSRMVELAQNDTAMLEFLYGGPGGYGNKDAVTSHYYFRTTNCQEKGHRWPLNVTYRRIRDEEPCLWGNMPPMKLLAVTALASYLGVTDVIESGRNGGMSALVYALRGFNTTSVELFPDPAVERDLLSLAPELHLVTGDGTVVVPSAVDSMLITESQDARVVFEQTYGIIDNLLRNLPVKAKVAVVIDGPKGDVQSQLAMKLMSDPKIAFIACDDSVKSGNKTYVAMNTKDSEWRAAFPMDNDRRIASNVSMNEPYFFEDDSMSVLVPEAKFAAVLG